MDRGLKGKVALVTGGGRDVGRAISLTLAREGAAVAVNYLHSKAGADETVAEIKEHGGNAMAYRADVAEYDAVRQMVEQVTRDHCCHVIAPGMVERKFGRIINISGDSARAA